MDQIEEPVEYECPDCGNIYTLYSNDIRECEGCGIRLIPA